MRNDLEYLHGRPGLSQDVDQVSGLLGVVSGEVGVRDTLGTSTTGTTDSVDIVLDVVGEAVVVSRSAITTRFRACSG